MNAKDLETLKANVDKVVRIKASDGEMLMAKVLLISEEDEDVIYDLISSDRKSEHETLEQQPAFRISFHEIESVQAIGTA